MTSLIANGASERGFTLVELMIVITVIGLASAIAVWSLPDRRGRVGDEALRFAARVRAAHDVAVVEASPVSIWVTRGGYGFDQRTDGAWSPMTAKPLRVAQWEDGTQAQVPDASGRVRITFDVTGLADRPVELRLVRERASSRFLATTLYSAAADTLTPSPATTTTGSVRALPARAAERQVRAVAECHRELA